MERRSICSSTGFVTSPRRSTRTVATALFDMLEAFPLTGFVSLVGVFLLISFFVTSSDSGSLVWIT